MKLYFALLEGITGYIYRNAFQSVYAGIATGAGIVYALPQADYQPRQPCRVFLCPDKEPAGRIPPKGLKNGITAALPEIHICGGWKPIRPDRGSSYTEFHRRVILLRSTRRP